MCSLSVFQRIELTSDNVKDTSDEVTGALIGGARKFLTGEEPVFFPCLIRGVVPQSEGDLTKEPTAPAENISHEFHLPALGGRATWGFEKTKPSRVIAPPTLEVHETLAQWLEQFMMCTIVIL
jgi:hypothetical protein